MRFAERSRLASRKGPEMAMRHLRFGVIAMWVVVCVAAADSFTLEWWTIDGGGEMFTVGGGFELSGTIGQPDASTTVLTGGGFELTGGFWTPESKPGVPTEPAEASGVVDDAAEPTEDEPVP